MKPSAWLMRWPDGGESCIGYAKPGSEPLYTLEEIARAHGITPETFEAFAKLEDDFVPATEDAEVGDPMAKARRLLWTLTHDEDGRLRSRTPEESVASPEPTGLD